MIDFLAGVPGKLATLSTNITTLLRRVSANVALAATALSSADWTTARAGYLDKLNVTGNVAREGTPLLTPPMAGGIVPYSAANGQVSMGATIPTSWPQWISHASGAVGTTFTDVVNITGSGVVNFAAVQLAASGASPTLYMDVIIDGATTISFATAANSSAVGIGPILIGSVGGNVTYGFTPVFEDIPFKVSLQIRVKSSSATYTAQGCARVRRNT